MAFNTFVSGRFFFGEKINGQFRLENALNLPHEFLYDNFNKRILLNFLVKIVIKNAGVKFDAFSKRNGSFIFLKNEVLISENVNC